MLTAVERCSSLITLSSALSSPNRFSTIILFRRQPPDSSSLLLVGPLFKPRCAHSTLYTVIYCRKRLFTTISLVEIDLRPFNLAAYRWLTRLEILVRPRVLSEPPVLVLRVLLASLLKRRERPCPQRDLSRPCLELSLVQVLVFGSRAKQQPSAGIYHIIH